MNRFCFGTKAQTLERLRPLLQTARIPAAVSFSVTQWADERERCIARVREALGPVRLAVRSSALAEDGGTSSFAGAFESRLLVDGSCDDAVAAAVDSVAASMTGHPLDEVLVQPMVEGVKVSGVIMTYDISHGAPYYVLNYDDESGRTDGVTGGTGLSKALLVYRKADLAHLQSPRVVRFLALARELEALCGSSALDIEFGLDAQDQLFLFQVRRIATAGEWHPVTERRVARQLVLMGDYLNSAVRPVPGLLGARTALAIMPDWNPAEILGITPRPLAVSLYRTLITCSVWREARAVLGYRQLPPVELMHVLNNRPYIDVRASFNSFLPAGLPDEIGGRLVDAWLDRLGEFPELHDKVEFEIAQTAYDFTFERDWQSRYGDRLPAADLPPFVESARALTRRMLDRSSTGSLELACRAAEELDRAAPLPDTTGDARACLLASAMALDECRRLGTFPFAVAARHAFVAEALLRSAVRREALDADRVGLFKRSVITVTGEMLQHYQAVCEGRMAIADFFTRYGHLRPGTYDITSLRYDEREDFFAGGALPQDPARCEFEPTEKEIAALDELMAESGLSSEGGEHLLAYARRAIAAREGIKFSFTKRLSDVLSALVRWGEIQGLSRDDLSFLRWDDIERTVWEPLTDDADRALFALVDEGRRRMRDAYAFRLSHIVREERDVYVATLHRSAANFIGGGRVVAPVAVLDAHATAGSDLFGRIVCIQNADPGFDWIFTRGILGLITQFGGANSHMAIRCAELGLPAAIGCGEQLFGRVARAGVVELDADGHVLRPAGAVQ